ncbi:MAG TPA: fatty acid desaturase [Candidatus Obscuribacterales bacterium]
MENPVLFISLTLAFYLWHTFGVTIGLHRLLSHRAFRCHKAVEYFFVLGAYLAYHGSPIWWATIHRAHHRYVETELDPHAPKFGPLKAYFFFRHWSYPAHFDPARLSPDLLKDPVYKHLEIGGNWKVGYSLNIAICILFRVLLFVFFGWEVLAASLVASIAALNVPLLLNIGCHTRRLGYRNFAVDDDSVNVWWFAIIGLGDGWHNNHHAVPGSSLMGLRKHELDPSWLVLKVLQKVGLVYYINESMREVAGKSSVPVPVPVSPEAL